MLDLNVEIISSDSSPCGDDKVLAMAVEEEEEEAELIRIGGKGKGGGEEEEEGEDRHSMGTTSDSSSVVNDDVESLTGAGDENSSSASPAALVFDVFKNGGSPPELVTRQLFPVPGGGEGELRLGPVAASAAASAAPRTQWLNLSFAGSGCGESSRPLLAGESSRPLLAGEPRNFQPQKQPQVRKSRRGPRSRSSQYRGVTFYRRTGRWESHIWDCGKQVYLGGFDTAFAAARAYDRAAIRFRGVDADINFSISDYEEDMKQMENLTKEEFVHILRRQGSGISRGSLKCRGIGLQKCGRLDARSGQFIGSKAHENADKQHIERDAVANHEHGGDRCQIAAGEGHGLDLNLGVAPPSAGSSKKINVSGNYRVGYINRQAPGRKLPMVGCSKRLPVWSAMCPFLLPSPEGKAVEKRRRAEGPTSSNIGWQMSISGNYGGTTANPSMPLVLSSNAASSGFSSSSSSSNSSASAHHLHKFSAAAPQNPNTQLLTKPGSIGADPFTFFGFRS